MVQIDQWSDCKLRFVHSNDTHYDWHCQSFYVRMVTLKNLWSPESLIVYSVFFLTKLIMVQLEDSDTKQMFVLPSFVSFRSDSPLMLMALEVKVICVALCLVRASNMGYMHLGLQSRAKENKVRNINTDMPKGNWTKIFLKLTWN